MIFGVGEEGGSSGDEQDESHGAGSASTTLSFIFDSTSLSAIFLQGSAATVIQDLTLQGANTNQASGIAALGGLQATLILNSVRITNFGYAGLQNVNATVTVTSSTIDHNGLYGSLPLGGGILNGGALTLNRCTVADNFASTGGGIYNLGHLEVYLSSIENNYSVFDGGGIELEGQLITEDTTFTGNSADRGGALFWDASTAGAYLELNRSTLAFNDASTGGGVAISPTGGTNKMGGENIIANNTGGDIDADLSSVGGLNLVKDPTGITNPPSGWIYNQDPMLGTYSSIDGLPKAFALLPDSPAIDVTADPGGFFNALDQRGFPRPPRWKRRRSGSLRPRCIRI